MKRSEQALLGLTAASALLAVGPLLAQWETASRARRALSPISFAERAAAVDNPAVAVARDIAQAVPADGCVLVLAYAGPAAVDYYNARLDYLLYPRYVRVVANSAAESADCGYLAVFRDTPQNLQAEPFAGDWDSATLDARVRTMEPVGSGSAVQVYRVSR